MSSSDDDGSDLSMINMIVLWMYPTAMAQCIILLEAIRTIPAEIRMYRRAWSRKRFNAAEVLFLLIKYLSIFAWICDALVENSSWLKTGRQCYQFHTMYYAMMLLAVHLVAVTIAWRAYIVFNCNRKALYILCFALSLHLGLTAFTIQRQHKTTFLQEGFCQMEAYQLTSVWTWAAPWFLLYNVIYDASVTGSASFRLWKNSRGMKGISGITGITKVLLYNNMHYVAIVCGVNFFEYMYLIIPNGQIRSLLGVSCAIQVITGMNLLISEQDAVHKGCTSQFSRRSGQYNGKFSNEGSGGGSGKGGVRLQQSTFTSLNSQTRSWLPPSFAKSEDFTISSEKKDKNGKLPAFHGITLSVQQHCSDSPGAEMDVERDAYPNLTGQRLPFCEDGSATAAGWTSTPLSAIHSNQSSTANEPLFFFPQSSQEMETVKVTYPTLSFNANSNLSPTTGNVATEDVTLLTRVAKETEKDDEESRVCNRPVMSDSPSKLSNSLSISSIRAQMQLRKIEAYRKNEPFDNLCSDGPFAETETKESPPDSPQSSEKSQSELAGCRLSNVKRKSVPYLDRCVDAGNICASKISDPQSEHSAVQEKPLPPAYSSTENANLQNYRIHKYSLSNPPNSTNDTFRLSLDEDLNATHGTFGGGDRASVGTNGYREGDDGTNRPSLPPLGLALPAMVASKKIRDQSHQSVTSISSAGTVRAAVELPSYNLQQFNRSIANRNQGSTHYRANSDVTPRNSTKIISFFNPIP